MKERVSEGEEDTEGVREIEMVEVRVTTAVVVAPPASLLGLREAETVRVRVTEGEGEEVPKPFPPPPPPMDVEGVVVGEFEVLGVESTVWDFAEEGLEEPVVQAVELREGSRDTVALEVAEAVTLAEMVADTVGPTRVEEMLLLVDTEPDTVGFAADGVAPILEGVVVWELEGVEVMDTEVVEEKEGVTDGEEDTEGTLVKVITIRVGVKLADFVEGAEGERRNDWDREGVPENPRLGVSNTVEEGNRVDVTVKEEVEVMQGEPDWEGDWVLLLDTLAEPSPLEEMDMEAEMDIPAWAVEVVVLVAVARGVFESRREGESRPKGDMVKEAEPVKAMVGVVKEVGVGRTEEEGVVLLEMRGELEVDAEEVTMEVAVFPSTVMEAVVEGEAVAEGEEVEEEVRVKVTDSPPDPDMEMVALGEFPKAFTVGLWLEEAVEESVVDTVGVWVAEAVAHWVDVEEGV